ncbi:uncharacterized protein [Littorina saxatilis]|uniref:uncharacterized protein n=1 Tax=Littorina saxatilis TaxID=31220 RepID=UPI0038B4C001
MRAPGAEGGGRDAPRQKLSGYYRALAQLSPESYTPRLAPALSTRPPPPPGTTPVWQNPVYAERRHRSENVCSKVRNGGVARLARYGNVSYCVVPKIGCTFWLNVFRFLHGDTGNKKYPSPFAIPRVVTHYGARKNMK